MESKVNLKALAALSLIASDEATRYYLCGVFLEISARSTTYVATNGHTLMVHREFLDTDEPDNTLIRSAIIGTPNCKPFKLGKRDSGIARLRGPLTGLDMTLEYDGNTSGFKAVDGTYPDWRRIFPREPAKDEPHRFRANWDYMATFTKAAKLLECGLLSPTIVPRSKGPTWVWFGDSVDTFGVLMPMRCDFKSLETQQAPDWVSQPEPVDEPVDEFA